MVTKKENYINKIKKNRRKIEDETYDFLGCLELYLGTIKNEKTKKVYKRSVLEFKEFFEEVHEIELTDFNKVKVRDIIEFKGYLDEALNKSNSSINKALSSISSFAEYIRKIGLIAINPAAGVKRKNVNRNCVKSYKPLERQELQILYDYLVSEYNKAQTDYELKSTLTTLLIFLLLIDTGMRNMSLCSLKMSDISKDKIATKIDINVKRDGKQRVYISNITEKYLKAYIQNYRKKTGKNSPLLVSAKTNSPLEERNLRRILTTVKEKVGLEELSPHILRATMTSHMYANGVKIPDIQKRLGHLSPRTTEHYIHRINKEEEANALEYMGILQ